MRLMPTLFLCLLMGFMQSFLEPSAAAEPSAPTARFEGTYVFSGNFFVDLVLKRAVVHTINDRERARLADLRTAGFSCRVTTTAFATCEKHDKATQFPPESLASLAQAESLLAPVTFGPLRGEPVLSYGSDLASVWSYPQEISGGLLADPLSAAMFELVVQREVTKIKSGDASTSRFFEYAVDLSQPILYRAITVSRTLRGDGHLHNEEQYFGSSIWIKK